MTQGKGHRLPGGVYPDLGSAANRGLPGVLELLAVTAECDGLSSRAAAESAESATGRRACTRGSAADRRCAGPGSPAAIGDRSRSGSAAARGRTRTACSARTATAKAGETTETAAAGASDAEPTEVALTHRSAPRRLDLAGLFVGRDPVVDDDVGIGDTADRAVEVVDRRTRIGRAVPEIVSPLALSSREVHRLRVDEFRALDGVLDAHPEAGIQQV